MKNMKKILALALVIVSVLAIAAPALALTWTEHYGPGTLYSNTEGNVRRYIRNVQYDIRAVTGYQVTVDGYYGNGTKAAVKYFQKYMNDNHGYSLAEDGICGPQTKDALMSMCSCTGDHPND